MPLPATWTNLSHHPAYQTHVSIVSSTWSAAAAAENGAYDGLLDNAGYTVFLASDDADDAGDHPLIVAETRVDIPDASVSDAVMMLDLRNTGALMFRNSGTGAYNMVYRRGDGTIGWVEPNRAG